MGPQNGIVGDANFGTDLPQAQVDDTAYEEVVKTARFSKTKEFEQLKEYLENRMNYYKVYMPDGVPVVGTKKDMAEMGYTWLIANAVIGEFKAILDVYEQAAETVKNETTRRKRT